MKTAEKLKKISFAQWVLYLSLFFVGIFHVYLSCVVSIVLLVWLWIYQNKNRRLTIQVDMTFIAMATLVGGYAITVLWAIDAGSAVFGFFKFLPLLLYTLVLMQEPNGREKIISGLPYLVTLMAILSTICMNIPFLSSFFSVAGRLSGFLQYPNSFAMLLLVAELLLITKERPNIWDYICISILLYSVLYTGSRTVFVLVVISNMVALFFSKNKTVRWIMLGSVGAGITLVLLYCLITGHWNVVSRYLTISTTQSTFVGRLLYVRDALPVIIKHPFGLGYMGYYFVEQGIQTGVYSVLFVHNDLVQILLDVGWIPFIMFVTAVIMSLLNRNMSFRYKLILVTMLLHASFDFDLQYVAIFMLLLLFMAPRPWKIVSIKKRPVITPTVTAALVCLCLYFGTAQALTRFDLHEAATKLYNHNTISDIELIKNTSDSLKAGEIADRILERNSHIAVGYSVKSRVAYAQGDFAKVIQYKNKAIEKAPFSHTEYWEYGYMLVNGIKLYEQAGDKKSADFCRRELIALSKALPAQKERLSRYGTMIKDQPILEFPQDLQDQIRAVKGDG